MANKICKVEGCKNMAKRWKEYCGTHKSAPKEAENDKVTKKTTKFKSWNDAKECHTGNVLVGKPQGISIYAGGSSRSGGWWRMLPYPDLAIGTSEIVSKKGPAPLDKRWVGTKSAQWIAEELPIVISLDFPDFGIPKGIDGKPLPRQFWLDLVDDIIDRDIKTISTQCMGGHGRSGIQIAMLLYLLTPKDDRQWTSLAELLAHIHEVYCNQAVEGDGQAKYIAEVCGIEEGDYKLHHSRAGGNWGGAWYNDYDYGHTYAVGNSKVKKTEAKQWCRDCGQWTEVSEFDKGEKKCKSCLKSDDVFKCDVCNAEYDWDIQHCSTCDVGIVTEIDTAKDKWLDDTVDYYGF